ncbi:MAG: hypothetical protein ABR500_13515 [Dermatophilaceae bacterium]
MRNSSAFSWKPAAASHELARWVGEGRATGVEHGKRVPAGEVLADRVGQGQDRDGEEGDEDDEGDKDDEDDEDTGDDDSDAGRNRRGTKQGMKVSATIGMTNGSPRTHLRELAPIGSAESSTQSRRVSSSIAVVSTSSATPHTIWSPACQRRPATTPMLTSRVAPAAR